MPALVPSQEMVKTVTKFGEEGKVSVRNVRRDILKAAGPPPPIPPP